MWHGLPACFKIAGWKPAPQYKLNYKNYWNSHESKELVAVYFN